MVVDRAGHITRVNAQTERLFGYRREELAGQLIEVLVPERHRQGHVAQREHYWSRPRARALGTGLELFGRRKDGSEFPLDIMLNPIEIVGQPFVLSVVRDITKSKEAERGLARQTEQLTRSNADLERFAAVASHDLQEPLRKIQAFGDRLKVKAGASLDEEGRDYLERMQNAAGRMRALIAIC